MILEDEYLDYEDEYQNVTFEKFTRKPKTKTVKQTKKDEISAKRRERENEKEMLLSKQDEFVMIG